MGYLVQIYENEDQLDRGGDGTDNGGLIEGVYDTKTNHFRTLYTDECLLRDIILGVGSSVVTGIAILVHTRSLFLTFVGILEIMFSFPLAYFVYNFVGGIEFFPFLNFMGIFVVFALGADHIFV